MATEEQIGNAVAKAVWHWLQQEKAIEYVPWVLMPGNAEYDQVKAAVQKERNQLFANLESVMIMVAAEKMVREPSECPIEPRIEEKT